MEIPELEMLTLPGLMSGFSLGSGMVTGLGAGVVAPFCLLEQSTTVALLVKGFYMVDKQVSSL